MNYTDKICFISCFGTKDLNAEGIRRCGYDIFEPYRGNAVLFRILREIHFRMHLPFERIFYKKPKCGDRIIVVFDALQRENYLKWLRKKFKDNRILLFYNNPVVNTVYPTITIRNCCELISCDPQDCKQYNLKYVDGYYFEDLRMPESETKYDIFYLGRDKGRAQTLFDYKNEFTDVGLTTELYITAPRRFQFWNKKDYYRPLINYKEVLEKTARARAILSIKNGAQSGITIRVFESVYNKKKLITDDNTIKNTEFYKENNVFILGEDKIEDLPNFLEKPWEEIEAKLLIRYGFNSFIENLLKDEKSLCNM